MKFVLMLGGTLIGVALGYFPSIRNSKPLWWRLLVGFLVTATVILAIYPPIAGTFTDAVIMSRADSSSVVPVGITQVDEITTGDAGKSLAIVHDRSSRRGPFILHGNSRDLVALKTNVGKLQIANVRRVRTDNEFEIVQLGTVDPVLTLPYIIGLAERARIIFFHVPMSWVAVVAYLASMLYSIGFIRRRNMYSDVAASSFAAVGTLYAVLATVTGAIWAKFNWGSFWNWDPREASIFLLLLIYAAYFLLRAALPDKEKRARISAAYSIVAFVTVPFLVFVLPRIMPGLHPGSADDSNSGPLLSTTSNALNVTKQYIFGLSLLSFTALFFWLTNLRIRLAQLTSKSTFHETNL